MTIDNHRKTEDKKGKKKKEFERKMFGQSGFIG